MQKTLAIGSMSILRTVEILSDDELVESVRRSVSENMTEQPNEMRHRRDEAFTRLDTALSWME